MTHKPSGIAQLFQVTKNKFSNIKFVNKWIKYKLVPVFKNYLCQTQAKIQVWLVTSPPIPTLFSHRFKAIYKNDLCDDWGECSS